VVLLGSFVPAKNSIGIQAVPYGYLKWWAVDDTNTRHAAIELFRPGVLLTYRDWSFIYLHDMYPTEQMLDAWLLYTPKGQALQRLELGQMHLPSGWEARTPSSFIHTIRRTQVISKLAQSSYDTGVWTQWNTPWHKGYVGFGITAGAGLNHNDPDGDRDYIVGTMYPSGDWKFEATRYLGGGVHQLHYTEAMAQWLNNDWMFYTEYWNGARDGNHYDGGYALLRKHLGGNWWTSDRWERLNFRPTGASTGVATGTVTTGHTDRTTLGLSYEYKCWRALANYDWWVGDNAPNNTLSFEMQFKWYPWTFKQPIQPQKPAS
jgi:hypothetical protein